MGVCVVSEVFCVPQSLLAPEQSREGLIHALEGPYDRRGGQGVSPRVTGSGVFEGVPRPISLCARSELNR